MRQRRKSELQNGCDLLVKVTTAMATATRGRLEAGKTVKMRYYKPLFERKSMTGERIISVVHVVENKTYTFEVIESFVQPCP